MRKISQKCQDNFEPVIIITRLKITYKVLRNASYTGYIERTDSRSLMHEVDHDINGQRWWNTLQPQKDQPKEKRETKFKNTLPKTGQGTTRNSSSSWNHENVIATCAKCKKVFFLNTWTTESHSNDNEVIPKILKELEAAFPLPNT